MLLLFQNIQQIQFSRFLREEGTGASKTEKSWEKEHKNQWILGKYLGQSEVFWGKKPGFDGLE